MSMLIALLSDALYVAIYAAERGFRGYTKTVAALSPRPNVKGEDR